MNEKTVFTHFNNIDSALIDFQNKNIVVMGLGRFGGGIGAARYLLNQGAHVLVTDLLTESELIDSIQRLGQAERLSYRLGEHLLDDFVHADVVVANPAVNPEKNPYIHKARQHGARITTEIEILINQIPNPKQVIGITGSSGKSTTTAMIGHICQAHYDKGRVWMGGNLGGSLLEKVQAFGAQDLFILELSSFMLKYMKDIAFAPGVAIWTNFSANHLDWHDSMEDYRKSKQVICQSLSPQDQFITGIDTSKLSIESDAVVIGPEEIETFIRTHGIDQKETLSVPGIHNQMNAAMAVCAVLYYGIKPALSMNALQSFHGLPHRLQLVLEHESVRFFNDSKSTTPASAMTALSAFESGECHVILGGHDKGSELNELATFAAAHAKHVYTIGKTGDEIALLIEQAQGQVTSCQTLGNAMFQLAENLQRHDVVLLSPGCASWDQFENYEKRGEQFMSLALDITGEGRAPYLA